jgi:hypothetical protein
MTTLTITDLEVLLARLGLSVPMPSFEATDVLNKPLDIGRCYFADILCSLVDGDPEKAYSSILSPGDIFNGDLAVVLPKLKPGSRADVLGPDLMTRVWLLLFYLRCSCVQSNGLIHPISFQNARSSTFRLQMEFSFESCSILRHYHDFCSLIYKNGKKRMDLMSHLDFET